MNYHKELLKRIEIYLRSVEKPNHSDFYLHVFYEITQKVIGHKSKPFLNVKINKDIKSIDEIPKLLSSFKNFEDKARRELKLSDNSNDLFQKIKQSLKLIPIARLFNSRELLYFIQILKTENLLKVDKIKRSFNIDKMSTEQIKNLKDTAVEIDSYDQIFLISNNFIFEVLENHESEIYTKKDKILLDIKSQIEIIEKHKNIQEFLLFVGIKQYLSKNFNNYWRTYYSFIQIMYEFFPTLFQTQFNFNELTTDDFRKRIGHYERVISRYPFEIINIWGLNQNP